jgi:parallel beta-helix repeat protein
VDAAAPGATVSVPSGVYRETVTIRKQLTLAGQPGAIIDGRNSDGGPAARDRWVRIEADGVTVRGFEMRYANNPNQQGAISNDGRSNVTFDGLNLHHANGAAISLRAGQTVGSARNLRIVSCTIHDNGQLGIHGWGTLDSVIENSTVFGNNTNNVDVGWEAGGMKVSETSRLTVRNSEFYGNNGPGLWYDINCTDCTIDGNRIHGNACPGIFYEVSRRAIIRNNKIWANGFGSTGWVEGSGIRLANTRDCVVESNTVAWNADGICISMQNRTDWPGNQEVVGNTLRNNLIALTNPSSEHNTLGLAFVWDTDNGSRGWSHSGNQMYHDNPGAPWACGGPEGWGPNDATWFGQFDANGAWLSRQEVQARLATAGIPTTP